MLRKSDRSSRSCSGSVSSSGWPPSAAVLPLLAIDAQRQRVWQQQLMLQGHQVLQQGQGPLSTHRNGPAQGRLQSTDFRPQRALSPGAPSQRGTCQAGTSYGSAFSGQQRPHCQRYHTENIQQQQQHLQQQHQEQHQEQQSMGAASRYGGNRGFQQNQRGARLVPASERKAAGCPLGIFSELTSSPCCSPPQKPSCDTTRAACVNALKSGENSFEPAVDVLDEPTNEGTASPPLGARLVSRLRADSQRGGSCRSVSNCTASNRMERQRQPPVSRHAYSSGGPIAREVSDTVPSINSIYDHGEERILQYRLEGRKEPPLEALHGGLSLDSQAGFRVENACMINTSRSHSTRPSLPRSNLSSAAGLETPVSVSSCLFLDAGREGSARSAALRSHSDEPSTFSTSRRALTASVSELQARLAAAEHQVRLSLVSPCLRPAAARDTGTQKQLCRQRVTHNFVGCLRREIVIRQLQQKLDSRTQDSPTRDHGFPLDAAAPLSEPATMLLALQQKLQALEDERGFKRKGVMLLSLLLLLYERPACVYLKEALKRKHLFEMELRAKVSSLLTLNEELQAEASTLMAFHRLTEAHGQAAAEKLLLRQARQEPTRLLTLSASYVIGALSSSARGGVLCLKAQAEGQTCRSKELQRLLANRESEVFALKREVALCRQALASFAASLKNASVIGALENNTTDLRPAIAAEEAGEESSSPGAPEQPTKGEAHGATDLAVNVPLSESSGVAEPKPSAALLTEASQSDPQESSPASAFKEAMLRRPGSSFTRPLDDLPSDPIEAIEDGPFQTMTAGFSETSCPGECRPSLSGPPQPPMTKLTEENVESSPQAEASMPQAPLLAVGGSHMIEDAHVSPRDTSDASSAEPADVSAPGASVVTEAASAAASSPEPSQVETTEPLEASFTGSSSTHVETPPQVISQGLSETSLVQPPAAALMIASDSAKTHEPVYLQPPHRASTAQQSEAAVEGPPAAVSADLPGACQMPSSGSSPLDKLTTISTGLPAASSLIHASLCSREPPGLALKENSKIPVVNGGPSEETDVQKPLAAPASHLVEARGTQTDSAISWMIADVLKQPSDRPDCLLVPTSQSVVSGASLVQKQACEADSQALVPQQQHKEQKQVLLLQPLEEASLTYTAEQANSEGPLMPTLGPGANPLLRFTVGPSDMYIPTADDSIDSAVALLSNTRINKVLFTRICQGVYLYGHLAVVMHLDPTGELRVSFEGKDYAVKDFIHSYEDEEFHYLAARHNQTGHPLPLTNQPDYLAKLRGQQHPQRQQPQQQQPQQPQQQRQQLEQQPTQQQPRNPLEPAYEGTLQKSVAQTNPSKEEGPLGETVALSADLRRAARALAALAGARRGRTSRGAAETPATAASAKKTKSSAAAALSSVVSNSGTLPPGKLKGGALKQRLRASAAAAAASATDQQGSLRKVSHAGGTKRRATSAKSKLN
ncbi:hypothetical protein Emag_003915 [Eimeria magna]